MLHIHALVSNCKRHTAVVQSRCYLSLRWRHNERDSVSYHQPHDCLLSRLFRRRSKKTSKLRVTGLCVGNSPGTGEFPAQMASYAENVSIWWRHHDTSRWEFVGLRNRNISLEITFYAIMLHLICHLCRTYRDMRHHDEVMSWYHFPHYWPFCVANPPVTGGSISHRCKGPVM